VRTTIDTAGRIVIPKSLRDEIGLSGGESLNVTLNAGHLEIEVEPVEMKLIRKKNGLIAKPKSNLPTLSAQAVRDVLDQIRR
jgi:AbrB family looped-hinge helix DNA binding protein